jgi:hypothetical protein
LLCVLGFVAGLVCCTRTHHFLAWHPIHSSFKSSSLVDIFISVQIM